MLLRRFSAIILVLLLAAIIISFFPSPVFAVNDYAWVLVAVTDQDAAAQMTDYNRRNTQYSQCGTYQQNDFTIVQTYIGPTIKSSGWRNGETATYRATFTKPPPVIRPGDEIVTELSLDAVVVDLAFFDFKGTARALRDGSNFENADGQYSFTLSKKEGYGGIREYLTTIAPQGYEGNQMVLQYQLYAGDAMKTLYTYEFREVESEPTGPVPSQPPITGPAWVAIEVIDHDALAKMTEYNNSQSQYAHFGHYARNEFLIEQRYVGPTSESSGWQTGESAIYRASFGKPLLVIEPGSEITTHLILEAVRIDLPFFDFKGSARALRNGQDFESADGRRSFTLGKKDGYTTIDQNLTITAPKGYEGSRMTLQYQLYSGQTMKTIYIYEYRENVGELKELLEL